MSGLGDPGWTMRRSGAPHVMLRVQFTLALIDMADDATQELLVDDQVVWTGRRYLGGGSWEATPPHTAYSRPVTDPDATSDGNACGKGSPDGTVGRRLGHHHWIWSSDEACAEWSTNSEWGALSRGATLTLSCADQWALDNCAKTCCDATASRYTS